jgi:hypothetical protein
MEYPPVRGVSSNAWLQVARAKRVSRPLRAPAAGVRAATARSMRRFLGLGVPAMLLLSSSAWADDQPAPSPPPQVVTTRDATSTVDAVTIRGAGEIRGRVTEVAPGDHVTIVTLPSGELKRIAWSQVERIVIGAAVAPAPVPAPQAPPPRPPQPAGPVARVHIRSSGTLFLYQRAPNDADFALACTSPCDRDLPLGDVYKIGGSDIKTTSEFRLDGEPGSTIEISVSGPSWAGIVGGGLLTIAGGVSAYWGLIVAGVGSSCSTTDSGCRDLRNGGLAALAIGAGAMALGLLIVYPSMKSDVSQERALRDAPRDAFVRAPVWRNADVAGVPSLTTPFAYERRF